MGEAIISRSSKNINIVQTIGDSTVDVMSQNASTDNFSLINHFHDSSDINTGVLSISQGGTNAPNTVTARKNLEVLKMYSLYTNSSGTTGTIALSDNVSNYSKIGVYFFNTSSINMSSYIEIEPSITTGAICSFWYPLSGNGGGNFSSAYIRISGTSLTFSRNCSMTIEPTKTTMGELYVKIYKVVGYNY